MRAEVLRWFVRGAGAALGAALVIGLVALAILALPVLVLVFIAVLLGSGLEPVIATVRRLLPIGRGATILIVYVGFFLLVAGLAFVIIPDAIAQAGDFAKRLPAFLDHARSWAEGLRPAALSTTLTSLIASARRTLGNPTTPDTTTVVQAGITVAEAAISVVTLLAIVFFWLTEHAWLQRYVLSFIPADRRGGARDAWNEIETRLGLWVRGQLILMGAMGVTTGIAYSILGLPSALLLGVIAGIAEAIPMVGPFLGAIPALFVAASLGVQYVLIVAAIYIAIQFVEANVLVPIVMRNTIGISPFLVVVSLLVGGEVAGVEGAFLAVPLTAAIEVVLERLQARDIPVAQDPAGAPTGSEAKNMGESLPDSSHSQTGA